jgi:hypothetical protein
VTLATGEVKGRKTTLTRGDWDELHGLQAADSGEYLGTEEKQVMGRTFVFTRKRYVLSDGTQVIYAQGQPKAQ